MKKLTWNEFQKHFAAYRNGKNGNVNVNACIDYVLAITNKNIKVQAWAVYKHNVILN